MTKSIKSKKIISLILAVAMLTTIFSVLGTVTAGAASDYVKMYSCKIDHEKYGGVTRTIYVQTRSTARTQKVYIHYYYNQDYSNGNAIWNDKEATLYTTLSDGSKIWKATILSYGTKYAIVFQADGRIIWDNNNYNDYTYDDVIGSAPIAVKALPYQSSSNYRVDAVLQNYAYHKNVVVRYTTNNWASFTDKPLYYVQTNNGGTETWRVSLDLGNYDNAKNLEYCVYYTVNGQTYWANNFGQNYNYMYRINQ